MDIEQKKIRFLSILSALYQVEGNEEIRVSEGTLLENELGGRDFWDVICPLLKKQGTLKAYNDPDGWASEFADSFYRLPRMDEIFSRQERLQNARMSFDTGYNMTNPLNLAPRTSYEAQIIEEIKRLDVEKERIKTSLRARYTHRFVVDAEKLLATHSEGNDERHIVVADIPPETTWGNMRFQFTGRHLLHVSIPKTPWARERMTPKDFGLERKNGRAMTQWVMLQVLSENDGKIPLKNLTRREKDTKQRQLTDLSRIFQEVFPSVKGGRAIRPMDGDRYECAFELIPEQRDEDE